MNSVRPQTSGMLKGVMDQSGFTDLEKRNKYKRQSFQIRLKQDGWKIQQDMRMVNDQRQRLMELVHDQKQMLNNQRSHFDAIRGRVLNMPTMDSQVLRLREMNQIFESQRNVLMANGRDLEEVNVQVMAKIEALRQQLQTTQSMQTAVRQMNNDRLNALRERAVALVSEQGHFVDKGGGQKQLAMARSLSIKDLISSARDQQKHLAAQGRQIGEMNDQIKDRTLEFNQQLQTVILLQKSARQMSQDQMDLLHARLSALIEQQANFVAKSEDYRRLAQEKSVEMKARLALTFANLNMENTPDHAFLKDKMRSLVEQQADMQRKLQSNKELINNARQQIAQRMELCKDRLQDILNRNEAMREARQNQLNAMGRSVNVDLMRVNALVNALENQQRFLIDNGRQVEEMNARIRAKREDLNVKQQMARLMRESSAGMAKDRQELLRERVASLIAQQKNFRERMEDKQRTTKENTTRMKERLMDSALRLKRDSSAKRTIPALDFLRDKMDELANRQRDLREKNQAKKDAEQEARQRRTQQIEDAKQRAEDQKQRLKDRIADQRQRQLDRATIR